MPRSSWSSRSTSAKPVAHRPPTPPTSGAQAPHTVTHNVNIERPGFFANVWQGFGLGAGQAIAHNIFRSSAPASTPTGLPVAAAAASASSDLPKEFVQCMKDNHNDIELCKQFVDNK